MLNFLDNYYEKEYSKYKATKKSDTNLVINICGIDTTTDSVTKTINKLHTGLTYFIIKEFVSGFGIPTYLMDIIIPAALVSSIESNKEKEKK